MNRHKIGQILLWIGALGFLDFVILTVFQGPMQRTHTVEELSGTVYAIGGMLWWMRMTGAGLAMMLPIMGVLLATSEKGSYVWLLGLLPTIVLQVGTYWNPQYWPPLFGLGGVAIAASYVGILWAWTQRYTAFEGIARTGKQVQLLGYSVLVATALLLCMYFGNPNVPALAEFPISSGQSINSSFGLGMLLLFLGHYLAARGAEQVTVSPSLQLGAPQPATSGQHSPAR